MIDFILLLIHSLFDDGKERREMKAFLSQPIEELQKYRDYTGPLDSKSLMDAGFPSLDELYQINIHLLNKTSVGNMSYLMEHAESQADREKAYFAFMKIAEHYGVEKRL